MKHTAGVRSHSPCRLATAIVFAVCFSSFPVAGGQQATNPSGSVNPFSSLALYNGTWKIRAEKPWGGGAKGSVDLLVSRCQPFTAYFACEQTVNGKTASLLVYTATEGSGKLHSRMITPDGLAGGRGDLTINGSHWTYLDKPPAGLEGNWSRVENEIIDRDHIHFEEYESSDRGLTWVKVNSGTEQRVL
jgi:hypothetical protein